MDKTVVLKHHKVIDKTVLPFHCEASVRSEKILCARRQSILVKNDTVTLFKYSSLAIRCFCLKLAILKSVTGCPWKISMCGGLHLSF